MEKRKVSYLAMAKKTIGEMLNHLAIWTTNSVINTTVTKIKNLFTQIETTNQRKNRTTKGMTQQKEEFRKKLNTDTDILLGIFRSNAKTTGNKDLFESSSKTPSDIYKIKDTEMMILVDTVTNYANNNLTELTDHGLTQQMITDYENAAAGFTAYESKPQELQAEIKTATAHLDDLFRQLDEQLTEHLDNHMMQFKIKEQQFYNDYHNARIIYDEPTISKSMIGTVVDTDNPEMHLQYVKVTIEFTDTAPTFQKVTTKKGNYQFKGLPEGKCKVTFEKNYYDTLTVNSETHNNNLTRLNVKLTKNQ